MVRKNLIDQHAVHVAVIVVADDVQQGHCLFLARAKGPVAWSSNVDWQRLPHQINAVRMEHERLRLAVAGQFHRYAAGQIQGPDAGALRLRRAARVAGNQQARFCQEGVQDQVLRSGAYGELLAWPVCAEVRRFAAAGQPT